MSSIRRIDALTLDLSTALDDWGYHPLDSLLTPSESDEAFLLNVANTGAGDGQWMPAVTYHQAREIRPHADRLIGLILAHWAEVGIEGDAEPLVRYLTLRAFREPSEEMEDEMSLLDCHLATLAIEVLCDRVSSLHGFEY